MKRWKWIVLALLIAAVAIGSVAGWRAHQRSQTVAAAVPPRPDLSRFPTELVDRVNVEERGARGGSLPAMENLAVLYQVNGLTEQAMPCLEALIHVEPRNPKWLHRLATIRAGYGDLDTAIALWERTVWLDPKYIPARIRLGDAYLKSNRDADAARVYEAVLKLDLSNPYALVGLARIDLKASQPARARERLEKAAEQSGGAIGTDLLVTAYEQIGDNARAVALRSRSKSSGTYFDPPDPWLDGMLDDCYDIFRLTLGAGFADHAGSPGRAREILERATRIAPKDARVLLQLGMLCRTTRDGAGAREYLERAAQVDPSLSDAWAQLVELYASMGDEAASAHALSSGLAHCPGSPGLHLERGRRLAAAGQYEAAIADYQETLRLRTDEADPLIGIAQIYLRQNRTNEAVAELKHALDVEPEHPLALMTLALYSVSVGDEAAARNWLARCELQVRVPPEELAQLKAQYAQRFGHPYGPTSLVR